MLTSWLTVLAGWSPACQAQPAPSAGNEMQEKAPVRMMTVAQQAKLMQFVRVGLKWVAGQIPFDEVVRTFGQPKKYEAEGVRMIEYAYDFDDDTMSVTFSYDKLHPIDGKPSINTFGIKVGDGVGGDVYTNIPYEAWDSLGLHRLARGELIDGVRTEMGDFFDPTGLRDISGWYPTNYVTFGYRLPMPLDSPFDVTAGFGYLGEWVSEKGGATLSNFRSAVNLRSIAIGRHYLTPEELRQRQLAKRQKYGEMNLCTGMICPETGLWEGWSQNGPTGQFYLEAGRRFPDVRTIPAHVHWYCEHVPGRWMWLKGDDRHKTLS
ncbi:hypothetical protein WK05_13175 [Burkholderia ubonensis]|nr:hypothetical protein [Burkholderia ubonensis]KVO23992.1 hypothetical protein WJ72_31260 [Burkholderia ubonensis]KVQ72697.1 hypothetical protein WK05_13175 [Burkholderia ubonensis]